MTSSILDSQWIDLLEQSQSTGKHLFYDDNKKFFFLNKKGSRFKDRAINELNLRDITALIAGKALELEPSNRKRTAAMLRYMANQTERKYFSKKRIALKLFNTIHNGLKKGKFRTTTTEAKNLADELEQITNSPGAAKQKISIVSRQEKEKIIQVVRPIVYIKDVTRTGEIIPTRKEMLGKGKVGQVFEHRDNGSLVVKKAWQSLEREYDMGLNFDHPNLVKIHRLYLKQYPGRFKYKLVMDKIQGKTISRYYKGGKKLSNATVDKLLIQVQDCCLYLFKRGISWADVNDGNIYILEGKEDLMLADFGLWEAIEDPKARALQLLLGSIEIVGWIVKSSSLRLGEQKNYLIEKQIIFPEAFFEEKIDLTQILSIFGAVPYSQKTWFQKICRKIMSMNDQEIMQFLKDYFYHVSKAFDQVDCYLISEC